MLSQTQKYCWLVISQPDADIKASILEEFKRQDSSSFNKKPALNTYLQSFRSGKMDRALFNHCVRPLCADMLGAEMRNRIAAQLVREKLQNPSFTTMSLLKNAGKDRPDSKYDKAELAKGVKAELEHTDSAQFAAEIAKDHLDEDPRYYSNAEKNSNKT